MTVSRTGKWISAILFISGVAAILDVLATPAEQNFPVIIVVIFQLIFSVFLYISAKRLSTSGHPAPYRYACWAGILYSLLISSAMGFRQYQEMGGITVSLPVTVIVVLVMTSTPFMWSLRKISKS